MLPRADYVQLMDGVDCVRVVRVPKRNNLNIRVHDMVTAVQGVMVVGLLAAEVAKLLQKCVACHTVWLCCPPAHPLNAVSP